MFQKLLFLVLVLSSVSQGCQFGALAPDKAAWIASQPDLTGAFSEIGAAQKVADRVLASGPLVSDLRFCSPYDMTASDRRYGRAGDKYDPRDYVSKTRVEAQLAGEMEKLPADPKKRRIVFADTIATSRGGGHGWMGFEGQLVPGGPMVRIVMHGRMFGASAREQKSDLGALGINLVHGALHHLVSSPQKFFESLHDDIRAGNFSIDAFYFDGPGAPEISREEIVHHLVSSKLAKTIELGDDGDFKVVQETTPRERTSRVALDMVDEFTDLTAWKARRISAFDNVKGIIAEVGDSNRVAARIFEAPISRTVYETVSFPTISSSQERYGASLGAHPNETDLLAHLATEYPRVTYHRPHRKFALAHIVETHGDVMTGWIGITAQFKMDGPTQTYYLPFRLRGGDARSRSEALGTLGVNLLYGVYHYASDVKYLVGSLGEDIPAGMLETDGGLKMTR